MKALHARRCLTFLAAALSFPAAWGDVPFQRGDVDADTRVGISDAVRTLRSIAGRTFGPCPDAADVTDNGMVQLGDGALLLEYLLKGFPAPPSPAGEVGFDPTQDAIGCESPGPPAGLAPGEAMYSVSVLPALGGKPGIRIRVALKATANTFAGRLVMHLGGPWAADAIVLGVRPSIQLSAKLQEDSVTAAHIAEDGSLRCVWMLSQTDFAVELTPGWDAPLMDITLCPGSTPVGSYVLEGEGEAVTGQGLHIASQLQPLAFEYSQSGGACENPVEDLTSMRPYVWVSDATAEPGQVFRITLWSTANFEARQFGFRLTWDPTILRVVGADVGATPWVEGELRNYVSAPPDTPDINMYHEIVPGRLFICEPCSRDNNPTPHAVIHVRNYVFGETRLPFPAATEVRHCDVLFQVLPHVTPGETVITLHEWAATRQSDNYAERFRHANATEDEIRYGARPRLASHVSVLPSSGLKLFLRGDANGDGRLDLSDAIAVLTELFGGSSQPDACQDARDSNDDGRIDIADAIFSLGFLFVEARLIPPPYPYAGTDPTSDVLGCSAE